MIKFWVLAVSSFFSISSFANHISFSELMQNRSNHSGTSAPLFCSSVSPDVDDFQLGSVKFDDFTNQIEFGVYNSHKKQWGSNFVFEGIEKLKKMPFSRVYRFSSCHGPNKGEGFGYYSANPTPNWTYCRIKLFYEKNGKVNRIELKTTEGKKVSCFDPTPYSGDHF